MSRHIDHSNPKRLRIQGKVIIERPFMFEHSEWFKPYVAGYYAFSNSLPHDKAYVLANMDRLLDFGRPFSTLFELDLERQEQ